jgi:phosphoglycolate phosphatase-like HAD superfamily hydrolase
MKALVFDMDGTIADLYGVNGWLADLRSYNPRPYEIATPLCDMEVLKSICEILKANGWRIIVTSWLSKDSTKEYNTEVRKAKKEWLDRYSFPYDEIHLVKYGRTKADCTRHHKVYQVLVDDNEKVRHGWHLGATIDANKDMISKLVDLIVAEYA